jgi:hypothetical protein
MCPAARSIAGRPLRSVRIKRISPRCQSASVSRPCQNGENLPSRIAARYSNTCGLRQSWAAINTRTKLRRSTTYWDAPAVCIETLNLVRPRIDSNEDHRCRLDPVPVVLTSLLADLPGMGYEPKADPDGDAGRP